MNRGAAGGERLDRAAEGRGHRLHAVRIGALDRRPDRPRATGCARWAAGDRRPASSSRKLRGAERGGSSRILSSTLAASSDSVSALTIDEHLAARLEGMELGRAQHLAGGVRRRHGAQVLPQEVDVGVKGCWTSACGHLDAAAVPAGAPGGAARLPDAQQGPRQPHRGPQALVLAGAVEDDRGVEPPLDRQLVQTRDHPVTLAGAPPRTARLPVFAAGGRDRPARTVLAARLEATTRPRNRRPAVQSRFPACRGGSTGRLCRKVAIRLDRATALMHYCALVHAP